MATLLENVIQNFPVAGVSGFSSNLVAGEANEIENTGVPLLGNVRPEVRKKRATPRWESLVFPNKDFPDLQSAIDALLPSGVLEIQTGHYQAGVTVDKPVEIRGNGDVVLCAGVSSAPVLSCPQCQPPPGRGECHRWFGGAGHGRASRCPVIGLWPLGKRGGDKTLAGCPAFRNPSKRHAPCARGGLALGR